MTNCIVSLTQPITIQVNKIIVKSQIKVHLSLKGGGIKIFFDTHPIKPKPRSGGRQNPHHMFKPHLNRLPLPCDKHMLNSVDIEWLERLLVLSKKQAPPYRKSIQEGDNIQICRLEGVSGDISNSTPGADRIMGYKRINCQDFNFDKTTKKGRKGLGRLEKRGRGFLVKMILDKGKRKMIKWTKEKPMASRI